MCRNLTTDFRAATDFYALYRLGMPLRLCVMAFLAAELEPEEVQPELVEAICREVEACL